MKPNTIILGFYDSETPKDFFQTLVLKLSLLLKVLVLFSFFRGTSPYKTDGFNISGLPDFPIRRDGETKQIDIKEYVSILSDILRMKKNLCLCRHFHRLDKDFITK